MCGDIPTRGGNPMVSGIRSTTQSSFEQAPAFQPSQQNPSYREEDLHDNTVYTSQETFPSNWLNSHLTKDQLNHIENLETLGFKRLADHLQLNRGYPWNRIIEIKNALIGEQLTDLFFLADFNKANGINKIMDFAITLAESSEYAFVNENIDLALETQKVIGQLTYLVNVNSSQVETFIENDETVAIEKIEQEFDKHFRKVLKLIEDNEKLPINAFLQNTKLSSQIELSREIAKSLITKNGTINTGLIEVIKDILVSPRPQINHIVNISYGLTILHQSPKLRDEFRNIRAPKNGNETAAQIIKATLDLSLEDPVTALEARQTVLTSLLSHLRQNNDGSCFASSVAIEILSSHLYHCFKDFVQLIHEGKLSRTLKNTKKDFLPILRIRDEHINKKIELNFDGTVLNSPDQSKLWDAPGIITACHAIGIHDPKATIIKILNRVLPNKGKAAFEIKTILRELSRLATQNLKFEMHQTINPKETLQLFQRGLKLLQKAEFAYSARTNPPLLKVWENVIASMAEAQESSVIKKMIMKSVVYALELKLTKEKIDPSPLLKQIFEDIKEKILQIRTHYDPTLITLKIDGQTFKEGGFVPYFDKNRIDSPKKFISLIKDVVNEVLNKNKQYLTEEQKINLEKISTLLLEYIKEEKIFIKNVLIKFDKSNAIPNILEKMAEGELKITPWALFIGNNSKKVLSVYLENDKAIHSPHEFSGSVKDRLISIIKMGQRLNAHEKDVYKKNPNKLIQFRVPDHHTGSLMLGHSSLANAWMNNKNADQWVQNKVILPGMILSNTAVDEATQQALIDRITDKILPEYISKEKAASFKTVAIKINRKCSIHEYRSSMIQLITSFDEKLETNVDQIKRQVDAAIIESLEPKLKKKFKENIIHIADTNWRDSDETNDNHLVILLNPGTKELELWEAGADNSHFHCLDQKHWFVQKKWEVFSISPESIADDVAIL